MSEHTHTTRVRGCHRCQIGRDEAEAAMADEILELELEVDRLEQAAVQWKDRAQRYYTENQRLRGADEVIASWQSIAEEERAENERLVSGIREIVRDDYCCHECFDLGNKAPFSDAARRLLALIGEER